MSKLPGALVTPGWLRNALSGPSPPVVLDGSWHLAGTPFALPEGELPPAEMFKTRRIPGARFVDLDAIGDPSAAPSTPHNLPNAERMAEEMARAGVTHATPVVCYDTLGVFSSPRLWWTLKAYGHPDVAVLDGGLPAWVSEGGSLAADAPAPTPAAAERWELGSGMQWRLEDVRRNIETQEACHVDARSGGRFTADAPEPRPGLRGGHVPRSRSLPFLELIAKGPDGIWRFRGLDELRAAFSAAGVSPGGPLMVSCGSGMTAAHVALAAVLLGGPAPPIYDGSWTEWGGQKDTPVETGPARL